MIKSQDIIPALFKCARASMERLPGKLAGSRGMGDDVACAR